MIYLGWGLGTDGARMRRTTCTCLLQKYAVCAVLISMDDGELPCPSKRRKTGSATSSSTGRKWSGAALYKTKFQSTWQQMWPFIAPVKDNPHSFRCTVCMKMVSCGHQGERDVARHAESAQHKKCVKAMKNTQPLGFMPGSATDPLKDKVI